MAAIMSAFTEHNLGCFYNGCQGLTSGKARLSLPDIGSEAEPIPPNFGTCVGIPSFRRRGTWYGISQGMGTITITDPVSAHQLDVDVLGQ
jgi:hypothetical protein